MLEKRKARMSRSDAGKLGAAALNADRSKKLAAIKKAAETRKAKSHAKPSLQD